MIRQQERHLVCKKNHAAVDRFQMFYFEVSAWMEKKARPVQQKLKWYLVVTVLSYYQMSSTQYDFFLYLCSAYIILFVYYFYRGILILVCIVFYLRIHDAVIWHDILKLSLNCNRYNPVLVPQANVWDDWLRLINTRGACIVIEPAMLKHWKELREELISASFNNDLLASLSTSKLLRKGMLWLVSESSAVS